MKIDKKKIAKKLEEKGAVLPCARCGKNRFSIADGFSHYFLQEDISHGNINLGGPTIPVINVICNNCGAMTPHALGALDMLPKPAKTPEPIKTPSNDGGENE